MPEAIRICCTALELVSRDTQPELWAALQSRIGSNFALNPLGDRAENLEQAIKHSTEALKVYTRQRFPEYWARTQNNLAAAHWDRIRGDRAENLEQAIEHYEEVLDVFTRQRFPQDWAVIQHNLVLACSERIITELRLDRTRLATLSACLGGRVEVRQGEEHTGLLQAMMTAGAKAVITSLWPINDAATRAFFDAFYSEVEADTPPAGALARAAREVRGRQGWTHPYYWAAFQANGMAHGKGTRERHQLPTEVWERIEEAHKVSADSTRGGQAMDTEKMVRDGLVLLEQMTENPEEVMRALDPAEGERTVEKLRAMEEQSAGVQNEADLLALADAVNRLVEKTPSLAALLLPEDMDVGAAQEERRITLEDYGADASEDQYVQEYAPQIRNRVVECRQQLERQLQELFSEEQEGQ